ncbi:MAG: M56 family metallopeptidase, partial [Bacillota bacterium]
MADVFQTVLTTSIYAAVAGLAIIMLKAVLKNRLNAQWHYLIWIVLILKLIMPFGPASAISLFNIIPDMNPPESMRALTYQMPTPEIPPSAAGSTEIQPAPMVYNPADQTMGNTR